MKMVMVVVKDFIEVVFIDGNGCEEEAVVVVLVEDYISDDDSCGLQWQL